MKAIIPVAGIGSRLRPHTHTQPKALVPVAGKPILSHIVDSLIDANVKDFIFVIGYLGDKIEEYIRSKYKDSIKACFVLQEPREGTGHAVWLCRDKINADDDLLIALGDTIFDIDLRDIITHPFSSIGVKKVDDPRNFGVVELKDDGFISNMIEKPPIPKSNLALVGIYRIKESQLLIESLEKNIKENKLFQCAHYDEVSFQKSVVYGSRPHVWPALQGKGYLP